MSLLVLKLFHLTIINGDDYRNKADNNRLKDVKITAPRGNIYDKNGKLLAGVKTSPAVQILKDEYSRLSKDEKISKIEELITILNKDGASWDTDDYFLGINYFVYTSDTDYFTESRVCFLLVYTFYMEFSYMLFWNFINSVYVRGIN